MVKFTGVRDTIYYYKEALLHQLFPSLCFGCEENDVAVDEMICIKCQLSLPYTSFETMRDNTVEKLFWGRVSLSFATSTFYYAEKTAIQNIIHHIKYRDEKDLGILMGRKMGEGLQDLFNEYDINLVVPMPLHPSKEKKRGYNQATLLCEGIHQVTGMLYDDEILERNFPTSTQTKKSRTERWNNVATVFSVNNPSLIQNKNIVLVDDVITTGASMEACARVLLDNGAKSIAIVSLAYTV